MASKYRHIAAWGRLMHSHAYYTRDQQELAEQENAPLDAIYKRHKGDGSGAIKGAEGWARFDEVTNADTRTLVERFITEMNEKLGEGTGKA